MTALLLPLPCASHTPTHTTHSLHTTHTPQVSPIGIKTPLPIILSHRIAQLQPDFFFLGAGEVDLKLGLPAAEFVRRYQPFVWDCTY